MNGMQPGWATIFCNCVQAEVRSLKVFAGIHEMPEGVHRMLAKRFPFAVYYLIEDQTIDVYAILDCRRDPEWIVKRLDSSRTRR